MALLLLDLKPLQIIFVLLFVTRFRRAFTGTVSRVGGQGRGRPWMAYINHIMDFAGCNNYHEMKAWAHDRD
ncbi:hypothetical protein M8J77_022299 [Diaphorina citri]|nr:hypothetical protein M8J77_022299 [Diaphorina citri]